MTTFDDLKNAIDTLLSTASVEALLRLNSNTAERAYEAYVMGLCKKAVENQGGIATITGIRSGPDPDVIVLRGGPGNMSSRLQDFCFIDCTLGNKRFEIHVDVLYAGQSGAIHEIDVSLYNQRDAQAVRADNKMPNTASPLLMAFECKFYTFSPGVALARQFVGLVADCSSNKLNAFLSNQANPNIDRYLSRPNSPEPFTDLTPVNDQAEDRFVRYLEQVLRKWASSR